MKKKYWIILIILIALGVWRPGALQTPLKKGFIAKVDKQEAAEDILQNDYQKIIKNLKVENIDNLEWGKINSYNLSAESLVNNNNAKSYFQVVQSNLPDLYSCLKKDYCGMQTRGEEDPYFDAQRTPAHILMNRNLKIMKEALRKDSALKSQVDWELLNEIAHSDEEFLQVEALDIIRQFDSDAIKTDELIKMTAEYKGDAKAEALVRIAQKKSKLDKKIIANEVEEIFAMSDANTVISVLEKMRSMNLLKVDVERMLKNLCRFKESHNWLMIQYEARKFNTDFETQCE